MPRAGERESQAVSGAAVGAPARARPPSPVYHSEGGGIMQTAMAPRAQARTFLIHMFGRPYGAQGSHRLPRLRHHRQPGRQGTQAGYSGTAGYADLSRSSSRVVSHWSAARDTFVLSIAGTISGTGAVTTAHHRLHRAFIGAPITAHRPLHLLWHKCKANCGYRPAPGRALLHALLSAPPLTRRSGSDPPGSPASIPPSLTLIIRPISP